MNLVIGPNGTGKSATIAAIALGLAAKPETIGRSTSLAEFVKNGEEFAMIEIEIKNDVENEPIVVRRTFGKEKTSKYKFNGEKVTESQVRQKIARFNIQLDNLCQFLAQDRVSEFARMNSRELLRETQRAAGQNLQEMHIHLIAEQAKQTKWEKDAKDTSNIIQAAIAKNQTLEREVQRYLERDILQTNIKSIETQIVIVTSREDQLRYTNFKLVANEKKVEHDRIVKNHAPMLKEKRRLDKIVAIATNESNNIKAQYDKLIVSLEATMGALDEGDEGTKVMAADIKQLTRRKEEYARNLEKKQADYNLALRTKGIHETKLVGFGALQEGAIINGPESRRIIGEIKACSEEMQKYSHEVAKGNTTLRDLDMESTDARRKRDRNHHLVAQLDNLSYQKLKALDTKWDKDVFTATEWLRSNRNVFKGRVFDPICLEISISDSRYANAVESLISAGDLRTFICTEKEDYFHFKRNTTDKGLRVNVAMLPDREPPSVNRLSEKEVFTETLIKLREYGFDGYGYDMLTAPEEVLKFLRCHGVHTRPVTIRGMSANELELIEMDGRISSFFAGESTYTMKRAYGQASTSIRKVQKANFLTIVSDPNAKLQLEQESEEIRSILNDIEHRAKETQHNLGKLRVKIESIEDQKKRLVADKREIEVIAELYKNAVLLCEVKKDDYERSLNEPDHLIRINRVRADIMRLTRSRISKAVEYRKCQAECVAIFHERTRKLLEAMMCTGQLATIDQDVRMFDENSRNAKADYERAAAQLKELKAIAKKSVEIFENLRKSTSEELQYLFVNEIQPTIAELENDLAQQQARNEMASDVNPRVIEEYKKREAEIGNGQKSLAEKELRIENLRTSMAETLKEWTTGLENIVASICEHFSNAFAKMGCAGMVQLNREGDYANWGIEIKVQFRAEETMQILTSSRQSGGERSVSTMCYLIAMQHLSTSPFRVVDEINQGMDPRNERCVHQIIVETACDGPSSSQYFLVTPKLLPDLVYHEKMRVLCIFNGPWQTEDWTTQITGMVQRRLQKQITAN